VYYVNNEVDEGSRGKKEKLHAARAMLQALRLRPGTSLHTRHGFSFVIPAQFPPSLGAGSALE